MPVITVIGTDFGALLGGAIILESVFAMLAGWVLLGQALSPREMLGCGLVFAGIILAQL